MTHTIRVSVNRCDYEGAVEVRTTLADFLRDKMGLTRPREERRFKALLPRLVAVPREEIQEKPAEYRKLRR